MELSEFLAGVERRAYKQALFAVRNEDSALDIVQDAMMRLAEKYGDRPHSEWPMLFQRILQNAIRDHYRRSKVRSMWVTLLSALAPGTDDDDPLDTISAKTEQEDSYSPSRSLERTQLIGIIEKEVSLLPPRQREAFLMRYWEDMDIAETAEAMGCTEGSVKTHCSRACHTLAAALKAKGIEL